jgi:hypothetical protein
LVGTKRQLEDVVGYRGRRGKEDTASSDTVSDSG